MQKQALHLSIYAAVAAPPARQVLMFTVSHPMAEKPWGTWGTGPRPRA